MFPHKRVASFFGRVLLVYALLVLVPWPGLHEGYAAVVRTACSLLNAGSGSSHDVTILRPTDTDRRHVKFRLENRVTRKSVPVTAKLRETGFLPTALLVALVLNTPIPWPRRWKALLWAMLVAVVFTALRLEFFIYSTFATAQALGSGPISPFWERVLFHGNVLLVKSPVVSFTVPFVIWALVCFRRDDWRWLQASFKGTP